MAEVSTMILIGEALEWARCLARLGIHNSWFPELGKFYYWWCFFKWSKA